MSETTDEQQQQKNKPAMTLSSTQSESISSDTTLPGHPSASEIIN